MSHFRIALLLLSLLFPAPTPSWAATAGKPATVSPWLYKKLQKTERLIASKSYGHAGKMLRMLLNKVDQGSYEQALVLRSLSSVYALQNQYGKAAEAMARCVALNVLPEQQQQQALLNLGQLYMATENYRKAVRILEPWLAENPAPNAELYVLLANAYAQLKQYRKALPYIQKAIRSSRKPVESWYQLNLALYYELNDYRSAARILQRMIQHFPDKKEYWEQLAAVYQQLKQYKKAVAIKDLAYRKGLLTREKEILDLANLFLYVDAPYKAGKLLTDEIQKGRVAGNSKNWELLANAWTQAREYKQAAAALETAARLNAKGRLYLQLGQVYVAQEQWRKAIMALNKAIEKGGLKHPGTAYILLGMSHYELQQLKSARQAFNKAAKYKKTRAAARQWLNYMANDTPG